MNPEDRLKKAEEWLLQSARTTYDETLKNAPYLHTVYANGDEVVKGKELKKCSMCDNQTVWASISFHAPFCSLICLEQMWVEYGEAERESVVESEPKVVDFSVMPEEYTIEPGTCPFCESKNVPVDHNYYECEQDWLRSK